MMKCICVSAKDGIVHNDCSGLAANNIIMPTMGRDGDIVDRRFDMWGIVSGSFLYLEHCDIAAGSGWHDTEQNYTKATRLRMAERGNL